MTAATTSPLTAALPARSARGWLSPAGLPPADTPTRRYSQGALALTFPLPSGVDCEPRSTALTLVQPGLSSDALEDSSSKAWAARFMQAVVEVLSSDRPLTQLVRWTDAQVYADIACRRQRVAERAARGHRPARPHVATVHICHPTEGSAEISARVVTGTRSRAIAGRLDLRRDRWICTALQFG